MPTKLNIGSGVHEIEGYTPIDRKLGTEAYPLKHDDNSVDDIRASHILEHFGFEDARKALTDWVRALKIGGRVQIAVPDFDKVSSAKDDPLRLRYLMGGQTDNNDFHKSAYTADSLRDLMCVVGLEDIKTWESTNGDCASLPISLNLEGRKGAAQALSGHSTRLKMQGDTSVDIKMCAVTSIPRLGFQEHWGCIEDALRPFRIPVRSFTGAFWGQHFQTVLETTVKDNLDWVLTLDYDSLFSAKHLDTLMSHFGRNPEIDAIAPIQARRVLYHPLCSARGMTRMELTNKPVKVETAHFGLTLLRVESLAKLPKPWFHSAPGPDGTWTHNEHIDPDIWFWKKWQEAGLSLYIAPDVRIGHLELLVSEFDAHGEHRHISIPQWREENGKRRSEPI